jgi:hypothetical protein
MNESEDPTRSNRPAPYGDPPEQQAPPAVGGPPAAPAGEPVEPVAPVESFTPPPPPAAPPEPEPAWEDVVDEERVEAAPPPRPSRPAPAPPERTARTRPPVEEDDYDDDEYDDEYDDDYEDEPVSRWVSLLATIGTALIGIVSVQVITSLVEGLTLKSGQRVGIADDLFHRLGYPFGGLGATALVFLVLGVVLVAMPSVLDELLTQSQDRTVGIALIVAVVMGVLIAVGSLLAVRANLHEYAAKDVAVPSYVRVQFTNFLLGALGAAALTLFGAIAAMNERSRERYD